MTPPTTGAVEEVVLLAEDGTPRGTTPKAAVHHAATPLHLAFSCYLFDDRGRLLLSRRALHKPTWPGAWTNSFCGHPGPGEDLAQAVTRRAAQELGVDLRDLRLALPAFRYEAVMPDGVRENEMCPVFTARVVGEVRPDPAEVAEVAWTPWERVRRDVADGAAALSPWCVDQVVDLVARQVDDAPRFADADPAELPSAARTPTTARTPAPPTPPTPDPGAAT